MHGETRPRLARSALVIVLVTAGLLVVIASRPSDDTRCRPLSDQEFAVNVQKRIATTTGEVEIELWSSVPFPVRALPPVLRIGDREFTSSRHPDDGSLNSLIFFVPSEEFERLTSNDPVVVYFGTPPAVFSPTVGTDGSNMWAFGTLRTELRDCPDVPERRP